MFGFGYQQKNARINNISTLVMFFAKELLRKSIDELLSISGTKVIFSHTDSFMIENIGTSFKEVDNAIRSACGLIDAEYFGNTEVISMGLDNINIKGKFEDMMILNHNSYIASTIATKGRRNMHLRIAGLNTLSESALGIDKQGQDIQDFLFNNISDVFSWNDIPGENKEFLYSILKHRLAPEYEKSLIDKWQSNDKSLYKKAVTVSNTVKHLNYLKKAKE